MHTHTQTFKALFLAKKKTKYLTTKFACMCDIYWDEVIKDNIVHDKKKKQ